MGGYYKFWREIHPFDRNPLQHRQYGLPLSFWKPFQQRAENIQLLQCCSEISSVFLMLWIHAGKLGKYCQLFKKILSIVVAIYMIHVARVQSAFRGKFMTTQTTPVKALLQQLSSTTRKISFFLLSKIIPKQIYPLSSAFPLTPAQKCRLLMNLHQ